MTHTSSGESARFPTLRALAGRLGVPLDDPTLERFATYQDLLLEANQRFNLTRITEPEEFETRVLADSLVLLPFIPDDAERLLDVGSGGGVPGLVIAIARPNLHVSLLDATGKKVRFLAEAAAALGLEHVTAIQGRAEELARDPSHREAYNAVTARAVARLATLVELTLPFVAPGGVAVLPKGGAALEELREARHAIGELGGRAREPHHAEVEGTTVIVIDKRSRTPAEYPRRVGIPNKTPLLPS